jgi:hypothetical protein
VQLAQQDLLVLREQLDQTVLQVQQV